MRALSLFALAACAAPARGPVTVALDQAGWRPFDRVAVELRGATGADRSGLQVTSAWGLRGDRDATGIELAALLPNAGPRSVVGEIDRGEATAQSIVANLPPGATVLDLDAVLAPWVTRRSNAWTADATEAGLVADTQVMTFFSAGSSLDVYSAPSDAGDYRLPALPRALSAFIVDDGTRDARPAGAGHRRRPRARPAARRQHRRLGRRSGR